MKYIFIISLIVLGSICGIGCSSVKIKGNQLHGKGELSRYIKVISLFDLTMQQELETLMAKDIEYLNILHSKNAKPETIVNGYFQLYEPIEGTLQQLAMTGVNITKTLKTRKGYCSSLSLLLCIYLEYFGYEAWYVTDMQTHSFVRYLNGYKQLVNVETTDIGKQFSEEEYVALFKLPILPEYISHGGKFELTPIEALGFYIGNQVKSKSNYFPGKKTELLKQTLLDYKDSLPPRSKARNAVLYNLCFIEENNLEYAQEILESDPENELALRVLLLFSLNNGEYKNAEKIMNNLKEDHGYSYWAKVAIANYYYKTGSFGLALKTINIALDMMDQQVAEVATEVHYQKALILLKLRNYKDAANSIDIAIRGNPNNSMYLYLKAGILARDGKLDKALIVVDETIANGGPKIFYFLKVDLLYFSGDYDAIYPLLKQVQKQFPDDNTGNDLIDYNINILKQYKKNRDKTIMDKYKLMS